MRALLVPKGSSESLHTAGAAVSGEEGRRAPGRGGRLHDVGKWEALMSGAFEQTASAAVGGSSEEGVMSRAS